MTPVRVLSRRRGATRTPWDRRTAGAAEDRLGACSRFLRAGLVDEITVTCIPILVGDGIALFGTLGVEVPLRLLDTAPAGNGLVQLRYEVVRSPVG